MEKENGCQRLEYLGFNFVPHQPLNEVFFFSFFAVKAPGKVGKALDDLQGCFKTNLQYSFSLYSAKRRFSDSLAPNCHLRQLI